MTGINMSEIKFWYHLPVTQSVQYVYECAKKGEEVGFDVVSHQDHFLYKSDETGCVPELWTFLTAVAATTNLTVSPLVMCNLFRNPALVAKIVATIDQLSKGRVYLAVGAGWWEEEFKAYGYEWLSAENRVDRAIESTEIIKRLFTEEKVDFNGRFWKIKDCELVPRPYTRPHPLLWNGGSGPRMLKMTGEFCDGWVMGIADKERFLEDKKRILHYSGGREMQFGHYFYIRPGGLSFTDARERIEEFIGAGVTHFIIVLRPDPSNLDILGECKDLIANFK